MEGGAGTPSQTAARQSLVWKKRQQARQPGAQTGKRKQREEEDEPHRRPPSPHDLRVERRELRRIAAEKRAAVDDGSMRDG